MRIPGGYFIQDPLGTKFPTPASVINALLPYIFVIAGLLLFGLLILGGFQLLLSTGDPKKVESAKNKLTSALAGFIIIFAAYWIVQALEIVFGIKIFKW